MRYLLDSHTWLWLALGTELSQETIQLCMVAASERRLFLSPFSVWELSRKALTTDFGIQGPTAPWMIETVAITRVQMAPFDFQVATNCALLPSHFHKDPVDRALAATCRVQGLTLLTRDRMLLSLASQNLFAAQPV